MKNRALFQCVLLILSTAFLSADLAITADNGEIPITTGSQKAKEYYLQGCDLMDKLRPQEALQFFEKAIAEDPGFALAYLDLALVQSNANAFFESFNQAKALIGNVSEPERLLISGIAARASAEPMKERQIYKNLVELCPKDPRAYGSLGDNYYYQQEYKLAISTYIKAIKINPNYPAPYNQLGYSYKFLENYAEAKKAFWRYTKLIPNDPNPHDSFAELLLKIGKYGESISAYEKALSINPNFTTSYLGIATNLNLKGLHQQARSRLQKLYDTAINDDQRRAALLGKAISYVDQGDLEKAVSEMNKVYAIAERNNNVDAMANDIASIGDIFLEMGQYDKALAKYEQAKKIMDESDLSDELKNNAKRVYLYNTARVAFEKRDFESAKAKSNQHKLHVKSRFQIRLAHELEGMIALAEKDYGKAIEELKQSNLQDSYNLFRLARAYQGKGEKEQAKELYEKTVGFNELNSFNYGFVRHRARKALDLL